VRRFICQTFAFAAIMNSLLLEAASMEGARVIVPAPVDARHQHLSWPKLVKTSDGTLVLAYIAGRKHVNGDGCPAISISNDNGNSFSPPQILKTFDSSMPYQHCANLAMGVAPDGAIILMGMAFTNDLRNNIYCWRSTDNGISWKLTDTSALGENKTGSVFGHVFNVPGKGLAVCGHYRKPKGSGIWIAYSKDQGLTWQPPETITEKKYFEPTFIFTSDKKLTGLVREDSAHAYHQYTSDNFGRSWSFESCVIQGSPKAVHPSPFIVEDPASPGIYYALQSERTSKKEIYLWYTKGDFSEWKKVCLVAAAPGHADFSYPWMVHLKGRHWFLAYYAGKSDGPNSIYGNTITIPESVYSKECGTNRRL